MLVKKLRFTTPAPAEVVTYLKSPVDNKYYTVVDWSWMLNTSPSTIVNYLSKHSTYDEIFDNASKMNQLSLKLRNYVLVQPAFNKFCFSPTTS